MTETIKYTQDITGTCTALIKEAKLDDGGEVWVAKTKDRKCKDVYKETEGYQFRFLSKEVDGVRTKLNFSLTNQATEALEYLLYLHRQDKAEAGRIEFTRFRQEPGCNRVQKAGDSLQVVNEALSKIDERSEKYNAEIGGSRNEDSPNRFVETDNGGEP